MGLPVKQSHIQIRETPTRNTQKPTTHSPLLQAFTTVLLVGA